jgi:hypothetical protein
VEIILLSASGKGEAHLRETQNSWWSEKQPPIRAGSSEDWSAASQWQNSTGCPATDGSSLRRLVHHEILPMTPRAPNWPERLQGSDKSSSAPSDMQLAASLLDARHMQLREREMVLENIRNLLSMSSAQQRPSLRCSVRLLHLRTSRCNKAQVGHNFYNTDCKSCFPFWDRRSLERKGSRAMAAADPARMARAMAVGVLFLCAVLALVFMYPDPVAISVAAHFADESQSSLREGFRSLEGRPSSASEAQVDHKLVRVLASESRDHARKQLQSWGFQAGRASRAAPLTRVTIAGAHAEGEKKSRLDRRELRLEADVESDMHHLRVDEEALEDTQEQLGDAPPPVSTSGQTSGRSVGAKNDPFRIPASAMREVRQLAAQKRERESQRATAEMRRGFLPRRGIDLSYSQRPSYSGFSQEVQQKEWAERPRDIRGASLAPGSVSPAGGHERRAVDAGGGLLQAVWGNRAAGGEGEVELPYAGVSGARLRGEDPLVRPSAEDRLLLTIPNRNDDPLEDVLVAHNGGAGGAGGDY